MLKKFFYSLAFIINRYINLLILVCHGVQYGRNVVINGRIYIRNYGSIEIGDNVIINSGHRFNPVGGQALTRIIVGPGGELRIGDGSGISNSTIVVHSKIDIGRKVMIGGSCNIWDTDFHSINWEIRGTPEDRGKTSPIFISDNVLVGAHSILLKGTRIGARAVIGAGSVGSLQVNNDELFVRR